MKDKDIMSQLTWKQRVSMCFWGHMKRYKYFDYLADGMNQRAAWNKANNHKKEKI